MVAAASASCDAVRLLVIDICTHVEMLSGCPVGHDGFVVPVWAVDRLVEEFCVGEEKTSAACVQSGFLSQALKPGVFQSLGRGVERGGEREVHVH